MWCGKKLCEHCIAKQEGKKYYCENCAVRLVQYKREPLPKPAPREAITAQITAQTQPAVKRRFVLGKDGYFELK
jgi:hypothetical protein